MPSIPLHADEFKQLTTTMLNNPIDLGFESPGAGKITIAFLTSFTNKNDLQIHFLAPLGTVLKEELNFNWETLLPVISQEGRMVRESMEEAADDLLNGFAVIHLEGSQAVYSFDAHQIVKQPPSAPLVERTIRGPKISLLEDINQNILLLRKQIRNCQLKVDGIRIGRRSQTKIAVVYLNDVANPRIVAEVQRRLSRIEVDGIADSGYIEQMISDNHWALFPLTQSTERPDKLVAGILEGRVVIIVDGSSSGIIVPVTVNELYQSPEDYYFPFWFGVFLRFFRILGNNIAVTLPGLYIAMLGVNPALLPIKFTLTAAGGRIGVAIPLVIEILFMEFVVEIFREGSLRLPTPVSQTLGVASGIILGYAAVNAGIVSNVTLIVSIIAAIASYSGPNYEIGISWRILRFGLIFAGAAFGLYGLTIGGLIILSHAAIQNSFGISYLSPWAPLLPMELIDTVFRRPLWLKRRFQIYQPIDQNRLSKKGDKDNR
ncbi:MAG TPA: spore germination protein [Bacillota bacterium]|nr:spore germination protein [Bacillota bacterium]